MPATATILMVNLLPSVEDFLRAEWGDRCKFLSVSNSFDVAQHLLARDFDAIITNYQLPPLSALDLTRSISSGSDTKEIPVAIFTRDADEESIKLCEQAGSSLLVSAKTPKVQVAAWLNEIIAGRERAAVPPSLDQNMAAAIQTATQSVMSTALGMHVDLDELRVGPSEHLAAGIVASVTVSGFVTGVITLFMNMDFARVVAVRMLGMDPQEGVADGDAIDAVGELTNMVAGKIKTCLCMKEDLFFLGTPSVVVGKEVRRMALDRNVAFMQAGTWVEHRFLVELSFIPNKQSRQVQSRQYAR